MKDAFDKNYREKLSPKATTCHLQQLATKRKRRHLASSIRYKMELVSRVSAFHNYKNRSDVLAERLKTASEIGSQ